MYRAFAVGLFETLPGLMVQPSLFALAFECTDETSRKEQLLSLVIAWGMTLKIASGLISGLRKSVDVIRQCGGSWFACVLFIPSVIFVVGALLDMGAGMRVYCADTHEDHIWNLLSGCEGL